MCNRKYPEEGATPTNRGQELHKLFQTLRDTGNAEDYDMYVHALDKYFELKKNLPKARQLFLSTAPEGCETINNVIVKMKKKVEYC